MELGLQPMAGDVERWIASAVFVGSAALLWGRLRRGNGNGNGSGYVGRMECRECRRASDGAVTELRQRVEERLTAVVEKIDAMQASLHGEAERRDATMHRRLAQVEAWLARLDERSKREHLSNGRERQ